MIRRHFSVTFIAKCLILVLGLTQGIFVTRLLGPTGKGLLNFLQANVGLYMLIFGLTLPTGVVFFSANNKISIEKIFGISYVMSAISFFLVLLLALLNLFLPQFSFIFPQDFQTLFYLVYFVVNFYLTFINGIYSSVFSGRLLFSITNWIELAIAMGRVIVFSSLFYFKDKFLIDFEKIFLIDLGFLFLMYLLSLFCAHKKLKLRISFKLNFQNDFKPIFRHIMPLYWTYLIVFVYTRIDYWVILHFSGLSQLGVYSIAGGLAQLLTFFPITINTVLYPYLSKHGHQEARKIFTLISKVNFILVLVASFSLFVIGEHLISFLYGTDFLGAILPFQIVLWGYAFSSIKMLFTMNNQINQKLKENLYSEIIVLVLSVLLNLILIPKMGIIGASTTMLIAQFFSFVLLTYYSKKYFGFTLKQLFLPSYEDFKKLIPSLSSK